MKISPKLPGYCVSAAVGAAVGTAGWFMCTHKPDIVKTPCVRTFFRSDGIAKKSFDSSWRANLQSIIQLFSHGEICLPY